MANLIATFKIQLTYQGPGGGSVVLPTKTVNVPYAGDSSGHLDVPANVAPSDPFDVPMGSIGTGATAVYLQNDTGQAFGVKVNAGTADYDLPAGGALLIVSETLPAAAKITAVQLIASATALAVERIAYNVFGDPE